MTADLARLLQALPDPALAEVVETHISWVLLAGEHAWKIKKPVTLPFLDYGTLAQRQTCCAEELRLNRRFAPELYIEVTELAGEPAVKMHRFPEAQRLDHVCARGELTQNLLAAFARTLADFQRSAAVSPESYGTPQVVLADALENFNELDSLMPAAREWLSPLQQWTREAWAGRRQDFTQRRQMGRIREGHGDLHLANLVLLDGRIVPFDAIEFNAGFRHIDVASEIAFTLLDLLEHRQAGLANVLLSAWLDWSGDHNALAVLRYYLVYRALVRAKVAAIGHDPGEATRYLGFAHQLITPGRPTLTITCGPSGCGKTWASGRQLAAGGCLDTVRIRSDVERKRIHGFAPDEASGGAIYTAEATTRTYAQLAQLAEQTLLAGWSVIIDAAFLKHDERLAFRRLAERLGAGFSILAPQASIATMRRRLADRRSDASEATPAVLEQQLAWFEALAPDEAECLVTAAPCVTSEAG